MGPSDVLRAPAKLNLTLEVLSKRAGGLHGLRSVMVPIDLCDELRIEAHDTGFTFACERAELQDGNLVERAFHALDLPNDAFKVSLAKRIPTGAGMGGGSSDAAAVLLAAQRGAFGVSPKIDYLKTARSLGSDVPFFLVETAALVEGTGERVTALGPVPNWHVVVVKPPVAVSTAWAYQQIDAGAHPTRPRNSSVSLKMAEALQRADFDRVVSLLQNDFHDVLAPCTPQIASALTMLREAGASNALMTGSGSCVFSLLQTAQDCRTLAEGLRVPVDYVIYTAVFWNGEAWRSAA